MIKEQSGRKNNRRARECALFHSVLWKEPLLPGCTCEVKGEMQRKIAGE